MPALPNVANVLKITIQWKLANDVNVITRFFMHYTGSAPTGAQLATYAALVSSTAGTQFPAMMPASVSYLGCTVQDLTSATSSIAADNTPHAGTRTGHVIPAGGALLVNNHVARRYRGGKSRSYLPWGVAEDLTDQQTWSAAFLTAAATAWNNLMSALTGPQWTGGTTDGQYNVSYYSGFTSFQNPITHRWKNPSTPRGVPIAEPVTTRSYNVKPGSQRRRNLHSS